FGNRSVRHRYRVADERFDSSQAFSERKICKRASELFRVFEAARFDRYHTAKILHLVTSQFILGMRGKARIIDVFYCWVAGKTFGNDVSVLAMSPHSQGQRFYTAKQQPAIERRRDRTV